MKRYPTHKESSNKSFFLCCLGQKVLFPNKEKSNSNTNVRNNHNNHNNSNPEKNNNIFHYAETHYIPSCYSTHHIHKEGEEGSDQEKEKKNIYIDQLNFEKIRQNKLNRSIDTISQLSEVNSIRSIGSFIEDNELQQEDKILQMLKCCEEDIYTKVMYDLLLV